MEQPCSKSADAFSFTTVVGFAATLVSSSRAQDGY
jgi:hypothetical protein